MGGRNFEVGWGAEFYYDSVFERSLVIGGQNMVIIGVEIHFNRNIQDVNIKSKKKSDSESERKNKSNSIGHSRSNWGQNGHYRGQITYRSNGLV